LQPEKKSVSDRRVLLLEKNRKGGVRRMIVSAIKGNITFSRKEIQ